MHTVPPPPGIDADPPPPVPYFRALPRPNWPVIDAYLAAHGLPPAA